MKLIDPVVYVENYDGEEIMKFLANMASTCYNYEFDISKDNYKDLLLKCIKDDHTSILEHKTITIKMIGDSGVYKDLERHRYATFSVESIKNLKDISGHSSDYILYGLDDSMIKETNEILEKYDEKQIKAALRMLKNIGLFIKNKDG